MTPGDPYETSGPMDITPRRRMTELLFCWQLLFVRTGLRDIRARHAICEEDTLSMPCIPIAFVLQTNF